MLAATLEERYGAERQHASQFVATMSALGTLLVLAIVILFGPKFGMALSTINIVAGSCGVVVAAVAFFVYQYRGPAPVVASVARLRGAKR